MSFTDRTLTCRDCGTDFIFTTGEQEFYAQKGFTNDPTRCSSCRQAAKANRSGRDGYGRGQREMHVATCASCGKDAEVPFVPRGDKPVYCSDCFKSQRRSSDSYNRW